MAAHTRKEDLDIYTGENEIPTLGRILREAEYWFGVGMHVSHEPPRWDEKQKCWKVLVTARDTSYASSIAEVWGGGES